jgi:hypothetical protein
MARKICWIVGGFCVVAASFLVTSYLLDGFAITQPPIIAGGACAGTDPYQLRRPFASWGGFAFAAQIPQFLDSSDTMDLPSVSKLVLCEDGKPLGPPHSDHDDIRQKGSGRYSHWDTDIVFSTSDNSNPNTNGRSYWVIAVP